MKQYLIGLQAPNKHVLATNLSSLYIPTDNLKLEYGNVQAVSRYLELLSSENEGMLQFEHRNHYFDYMYQHSYSGAYLFLLGFWMFCDGENLVAC